MLTYVTSKQTLLTLLTRKQVRTLTKAYSKHR